MAKVEDAARRALLSTGAKRIRLQFFAMQQLDGAKRSAAFANRAVRQEFLDTHAPALTVIVTGVFDEQSLPEIEAVAVA